MTTRSSVLQIADEMAILREETQTLAASRALAVGDGVAFRLLVEKATTM